jgi:hypothetical protein
LDKLTESLAAIRGRNTNSQALESPGSPGIDRITACVEKIILKALACSAERDHPLVAPKRH